MGARAAVSHPRAPQHARIQVRHLCQGVFIHQTRIVQRDVAHCNDSRWQQPQGVAVDLGFAYAHRREAQNAADAAALAGALVLGRSYEHPATTEISLRAFLQTPHPTMPNLMLTPEETDDIIAYLLALKNR